MFIITNAVRSNIICSKAQLFGKELELVLHNHSIHLARSMASKLC